jgi:hypothetical protein
MASVADQLNWFKSEGLITSDIGVEKLVDPQYVQTIG